ncbi:MAG: M15 family metallopeptidase [Treponema sp.]|nr:M15 family metallopeptidase [Candidatus Treponema caballi]
MTSVCRKRFQLIHPLSIIRVFILFLMLFCTVSADSQSGHLPLTASSRFTVSIGPSMLKAFQNAYPDVEFTSEWDNELSDWRITMNYEGRTIQLYWCDGRMLPLEKFDLQEKYDSLLYVYPYYIPDPATFSDEKVQEILDETSVAVRTASYGTGTFFYDFIYDTTTRTRADRHIVKTTFLGKTINVHEKLKSLLQAIERDVKWLAQSDTEVNAFVTNLDRCDGFNWREIADSGNRSVHSLGIAVDILPKGWGQKNLYWQWRRDIAGDAWVTTPLSRRWLIPDKVVAIFEKYGFVYGAKWKIWDNMHMEYKPELLEYRSLLE